MNLVLGRCVLCEKPTLAGMCAHCRKNAPQRRMIPWPSLKLLKMLDPSDQLLRQDCDRCHKPFMLSAGYLLRKLLSKRAEAPKRTCKACVERDKEAARKAVQKKLEEEQRRKIEEKRRVIEERRKKQAEALRKKQAVQRRSLERGAPLVHQPFAGNESLTKLKKELRKVPRRPHHQKSTKEAK
jgi:Zn-finger protein